VSSTRPTTATGNLTAVHIGLVILPTDRWKDARRQWEWADEAGFSTAWTYDHIRWGGMSDGPWLAALPVLAAAAVVTHRIRLGTLVASPNFRHPVALARDVIALDDLSNGRFDLGVGPGSGGPDAEALGQEPWPSAERMDRYTEFLQTLRQVLDGEPGTRSTITGKHYAARDAPSTPGTLQRPLPLTVAAGGPRGLLLAATYGQQWVTIGPRSGRGEPDEIARAVATQCAQLVEACAEVGRDPATLRKVVLWTPREPAITSLAQFDEVIGPYQELGIDQFVLHHPEQTGPYSGSVAVFEQIAARSGETGA
jgi:alkanesulfonate monooxygenase SsuD/methylene tetrahydromethanopterin reductase-like flavin-dependent oxidoreductase (luciferase family)